MFGGRGSTSSPGNGPPQRILLSAAHQLADICPVPRWQLTCEWVRWLDSPPRSFGLGWAGAGRRRAVDGVETSAGKAPHGRTLVNGTTSSD